MAAGYFRCPRRRGRAVAAAVLEPAVVLRVGSAGLVRLESTTPIVDLPRQSHS